MSILNHSGLRALGSASVAAFALAACGGSSSDDLPLIRANLNITAVSQGGVCETIPVRVTPKELKGPANKYANNRMMVTDVSMTGPTDEAGAPMCHGTAQTLPLAPGDWEFSAPLASGTTTCVRDIQSGGDLDVKFVDGATGCGGPESSVPPLDPLAPPAEGDVPAEGATPPEPATG